MKAFGPGAAIVLSVMLVTTPGAAEVTDLMLSKSGNDVQLDWTPGTSPYRVLRSLDPRFVSGNASVADGLGSADATDAGALLSAESYFYVALGDDEANPPFFDGLFANPWQSEQTANYPQLLTGQDQANHVQGYRFTPLIDGSVTQLGGYFEGQKTVALFEAATGSFLGQAQVDSALNWSYSNLDDGPVAVTAGTDYIVAVRMDSDSSGVMRWSVGFPFVRDQVRVDNPVTGWTPVTDPASWPLPAASASSDMKGFADITFSWAGTGNQAPGQPHTPDPVDGGTVTTSSYVLSWGASADPDLDPLSYDVELRDSTGSVAGACLDVPDGVRQCAIASLQDGEAYTWEIVAEDPQGATSTPLTWTFTVSLPVGGCPTASPTMPQLDGNAEPLRGQDVVGCTPAFGFGTWSSKPGVPTLSQDCKDLHDSYWVNGYDSDHDTIYPTWHPPIVQHPVTGETCSFGHEHGNDPSASALFDYWGGWPAFGYAAEQYSRTQPPLLDRHEDHFGHKVTSATYRASIGNPPNHEVAVYDSGFYCHFLSKIHQGSHSVDALTNQLHEYFIAIRCDDNPLGLVARMNDSAATRLSDPANIRTEYSIKMMVPFGRPDEFKSICGTTLGVATGNTLGFGGAELDLSDNPGVLPVEPANPREIGCFSSTTGSFQHGTPDTITQLDLWTQPTSVGGPAWALSPSLFFQAYYVVKDPLRVYDPVNQRAAYTVEYCKDVLSSVPGHRFCAAVTPSMGPFDASSPFKGALRAVHFKSLFIFNNTTLDSGGQPRPADFCTDPLGRTPAEVNPGGTCAPLEIRQKLKPFDGSNGWTAWQNPVTGVTGGVAGSLYVLGQALQYPNQPATGADFELISGPLDLPGQPGATGLFAPVHGGGATGSGCPIGDVTYHVPGDPTDAGLFLPLDMATILARKDHAYCPVGIGHEKLVDNTAPNIQGPN